MRHALVVLIFLTCCSVLPAMAQDNERIRGAIVNQRDKAENRQDAIEGLEKREKKLVKNLATIEKQMKTLLGQIAVQEDVLISIETREAEAQASYLELQAWRNTLVEELRQLLGALWPIHTRSLSDRLQGIETWKDADRRFTWLAAIYRATGQRMEEAARASKLMTKSLMEQALLAKEASAQLAQINTAKDELLKKKLSVRSSLRRAKNKRTDLEQELRAILTIIKDLNYKLTSQRTKRFADNKKLLPWPADGAVFSSFSPWSTPPRRGIALSTDENAQVKSVFWGKVVHADSMRGFGQVVIVYHGNDYYSVYAYLAQSLVSAGQEVEKDEPLGVAGFHPKTRKPGLYFELRLGSKPINPMKWLFPK